MPGGRVSTATVLFCDLVGSTAQRTALGDDEADTLALALDIPLRESVARHLGSVVKSTGDGLMAVFDAASDALSAAIASQQAAEFHNRGVAEREHLVLRIGVSAGDVHFVAHDCHGTPVVEAARLESIAEPGSIFVSGLARALAGSRGRHAFDLVGNIDLKGLPDTVETYRVRWEPLGDVPPGMVPAPLPLEPVRVPLPARFATGRVFVGREVERAALASAFDAARADGLRRVVLVSGEPGAPAIGAPPVTLITDIPLVADTGCRPT